MGVKHTHADLIKAWADGADIQHLNMGGGSMWTTISKPTWDSPVSQYRIKPQPPQEPNYATIAKNGFICSYNSATKWKAAARDVIAAYQKHQEDIKVYQNGNS